MIKLLLSIILIISVVANGQANTFLFNTTLNCAAGCKWNVNTNWIGNNVPTENSNVVIDFSQSNATVQQLIISNGNIPHIPNLNSIVIIGAILQGTTPNVVMTFTNPNFEIAENFTLTNANLNINEGTIEVASFLPTEISVTTLNGATTGGLNVNTQAYFPNTSTLVLQGTGNFYSSGIVNFYSKPKCYDSTCRISCDGPNSIFEEGLNSEGIVFFAGMVYLNAGLSYIDTLSVSGTLTVNNATLKVGQTFDFGSNSLLTINSGANVEVDGQGTARIISCTVAPNATLFLAADLITVSSLTSQGLITVESPGATISNAIISEIILQGVTTAIELNNATITELHSIMNIDGSEPQVVVNFVGTNSAVNITSAGAQTTLTVIDESVLTVTGNLKLIGTGGITVMGKLNLEGCSVNTGSYGLGLNDPNAELYANGVDIVGDVTINGGSFEPVNANIYGNLFLNQGYLSLNYPGSTLTTQGFQLSANGSLYIFDSQNTITPAPFIADTTALYGTIIVQFENSIEFNGNYPIIEVTSAPLNISLSVVSPLYNSLLYEAQDYEVSYSESSSQITLNFFTAEEPSKKLAGWKVFLIILSIFTVLGGGCYAFYKYRRNQGYIPLN